ncbi:hypothetical protein SAY86_023324 [Trapa natans]|uniref:Uncharacterized protein n=1 Tax=Trapa natans TaxID=22666 RepID=A0AAN7R5P5_TRANT|nr:hypothetical protein SAY86_023324 [Trapa natans]
MSKFLKGQRKVENITQASATLAHTYWPPLLCSLSATSKLSFGSNLTSRLRRRGRIQ